MKTLKTLAFKLIITLSALCFFLAPVAYAGFASSVSYHDWGAFPITLAAKHVSESGMVINFHTNTSSLTNGDTRRDSERWFLSYGKEEGSYWRIGVVYIRDLDIERDVDTGSWKSAGSHTTLSPLVGVGVERRLSSWLRLRAASDVFGNGGAYEYQARAELSAWGLSIGYTFDSSELYTGPHIAYEFRAF